MITIRDPNRFINKLEATLKHLDNDFLKELLKLGYEGANEMRIETNKSKSGRLYGSHKASAKGEAPAKKSGKLYNTLGYRKFGRDVLVGSGDSTMKYDIYLQNGTRTIEPRPLVAFAYKKCREQSQNVVFRGRF